MAIPLVSGPMGHFSAPCNQGRSWRSRCFPPSGQTPSWQRTSRPSPSPPPPSTSLPSSQAPSWQRTSHSSPSPLGTSPPSSPPKTVDWTGIGQFRNGLISSPPQPPRSCYAAVKPGEIYFLPAEENIDSTSRIWSQLATSGNWRALSHPIVALGNFEDADGVECIQFCVCTSMGGHGIPNNKTPEEKSRLWLIAHPNQQPHDGTSQLELAPGSNGFEEITYVRTGISYVIEASQVQKWESDKSQPITLDQDAVRRIKAAS